MDLMYEQHTSYVKLFHPIDYLNDIHKIELLIILSYVTVSFIIREETFYVFKLSLVGCKLSYFYLNPNKINILKAGLLLKC